MASNPGFACATRNKCVDRWNVKGSIRMSQKLKVRGAQLKREAVKFEGSKIGREQKLSAGPREGTAVTVGPALEPKPSKGNASLLPGDNLGREVKAMNDEGNASKKLFEGFSDM